MAEAGQPEQKPPSPWIQRIKNVITTGLRNIGVGRAVRHATREELQYELVGGQEFPPIRRLKEKNLIEIMKDRSGAVFRVENNWDFFEGLRSEVEDIYASSMMYIDVETGRYEFGIYQNGVGGGASEKDEFEEIPIRDKRYNYPLPPKVKIRYPILGMKRDWTVTISPFGYNVRQGYISKYIDLIKQICEDAQINTLSSAKTEDEKNAIINRINHIRTVYSEKITSLLNEYCTLIEDNYFGFIKGATDESFRIEGKYSDLYNKRLRKQDFLYYNNFDVIQPILYGKGAESAMIKDKLSDPRHGWITKENELAPGLDQYGYALEVDEDGIVMIDKHPDSIGPQRRVLSQFIKKLDLLETVNYMNAHHDTYRDDLRDGRYHPKSITVMDYIQANNKSIWNLWDTRKEEDIISQSKFDVKKNTSLGEGEIMPINITPTDKNPAFDISFIKGILTEIPSWKHAGRKYYYDVPDGTMSSKNNEVHISSRGVSMYIIEKITRESRKFEDTVNVLNQLSGDVGFDIGTRPWELWGKTMIQRPYSWREIIDQINKVLESKISQFRERVSSNWDKIK